MTAAPGPSSGLRLRLRELLDRNEGDRLVAPRGWRGAIREAYAHLAEADRGGDARRRFWRKHEEAGAHGPRPSEGPAPGPESA